MKSRTLRRTLLVALLTVLTAMPAVATTVLHMDLTGLSDRAELIFRGTVLSVEPGSVAIGGGELPTTVYRVRVDETFKGAIDAGGKDVAVVEMTVVGDLKQGAPAANGMVRLAKVIPDPPRLERGGEYVLFVTAQSAAGLSTTVGLGQGAFKIFDGPDHQEMAVNEVGNLGLFDGPVTYATLAAAIRARVGG